MSTQNIFLCSPLRTAIGSFQGSLSSLTAVQMASELVKEIITRTHLPKETIDEVILGSVLTAGQGQAPARQVVIRSGLPALVQAMTINKVCSSGLKAVMLAANSVAVGQSQAVLAGGMESMSNAPYLMPNLRGGARYGNTQAEDSIIKDGLWDVYNNFLMGDAAEICAKEYNFSRSDQDSFAIESYKRAKLAIDNGAFKDEIVPLKVKKGKEEVLFDTDEEPGKGNIDKIPTLKPAFQKEGTITAGNASSLNDGACVMVVCTEEYAKKNKLTPMARVLSQGWHGQAPEWFTTAPVNAIKNAVQKASLTLDKIDLFELNEAFSVVSLACQRDLNIPSEKLNVNGGAVALGHPIGASGARILTTLLYTLKRRSLKYGAVGICNGGGEATALVVERV